MPQKYKVFIGENPLLIIADLDRQVSHNHDVVLSEQCDDFELEELYLRLVRHSDMSALWIHSDPEKAFARLCKRFKIVEAAGGIVSLGNKFLFILRHGKWDLPKGKAEKGESRLETAKREVEEECGFLVDSTGDLAGVTYHTYERDGFRVLKPSYWFWMKVETMPNLKAQEEEGITDLAFLDYTEINAVLDDMYVSIRELVIELGLNRPKP